MTKQRRKTWTRNYCTHEGEEKCIPNFGGETCRKNPSERSRYRFKGNVQIGNKETGLEGVNLFYVVQDRKQRRTAVHAVIVTELVRKLVVRFQN